MQDAGDNNVPQLLLPTYQAVSVVQREHRPLQDTERQETDKAQNCVQPQPAAAAATVQQLWSTATSGSTNAAEPYCWQHPYDVVS
jgi:hypothetical protein